jgi:hypothetical protein
VNEDANCRTRIEKDRRALGWKIAKVNEVLEQEYGKKLNIETSLPKERKQKVQSDDLTNMAVDALKGLGHEDVKINAQVGSDRASIYIPSE